MRLNVEISKVADGWHYDVERVEPAPRGRSTGERREYEQAIESVLDEVRYFTQQSPIAAAPRSEISCVSASTQVNTATPPFGFRSGRIQPPTAT